MIDDRNSYNFEANKTYEETFEENNADLIKELTGTSEVVSLSQTKLDVFAGIDLLVQQGRSIVGIALRIRKPTAYKWRSMSHSNGVMEKLSVPVGFLIHLSKFKK